MTNAYGSDVDGGRVWLSSTLTENALIWSERLSLFSLLSGITIHGPLTIIDLSPVSLLTSKFGQGYRKVLERKAGSNVRHSIA